MTDNFGNAPENPYAAPAATIDSADSGFRTRSATAGGEHEFDESQNASFMALSRVMKSVGLFYILGSPLFAVAAIYWFTKTPLSGVVTLVSAAALLAQGLWARSAAGRFERIVTDIGRGVANLMAAFEQLRKFYIVTIVAGAINLLNAVVSTLLPYLH